MFTDLFSHTGKHSRAARVWFSAMNEVLGGKQSGGSKFVRGNLEFHTTEEERVIIHTAAPLS